MLIHGKQIKGNTVGPEQVKKGEDVIYDFEGAKITGLGSPVNLSDAATKEYVDALGNSNNYCQPVDILIKTSMSNAGSRPIGTRALCINANTPGVYEYTTSGWKIASDWQTIAVTPFATLVPVRATGTVYVAGRKENESIKFTELPQNVLAYSFDDYFKTTSYDGGISVSINPQKIASMAVIQELVTTINSKQDKLTASNAGDGIKIQNGKISMKLFDNGDPGWAIMQDGSFRLKYASENQSGIISAEDYIRIREASRSNQADWNENIDWTGSYVNNRTHYIEPKALYDSNVTIGSVSTQAIDISTSVEPNEIQVGHNISLVTSEFGVMKSTIAEEEIQSGGLLLTVYRAYFDNNIYVEFKNDFTEMEIYNGNAYSINYISSYDSDIYTVKKLDPMFLPEISVIDLASGSPSDLLHEYALIREDGVQLGVTIEVPKDKVIESAETGKVTQEDKEPGGIFYGNDDFQVGDIYIDLTIYVGGSPSIDHVYINVSKMNIGLYQGSENITVSEPDEHGVKTISLNDDVFLNGVVEAKDFIIPGSPETSLSQVAGDLYSLNIKNGSSESSLRQVSSAEEGEDYTIGRNASAFGEGTRATGVGAFAEGKDTLASGNYSHAEGSRNTVDRVINFTYVDGEDYYLSDANVNKGDVIDLNGSKIRVIDYVYNYQQGTRKVTFDPTHPEYQDFSGAIANGEARGQYSHSEGVNTFALGEGSHAEGNKTIASGRFSHAEGESTFAEFVGAHAEGYLSKAHGYNSHAEGNGTLADANSSHAEGTGSEARGDSSHAEGYKTTASGQESHAEGYQTIADGSVSHAEGDRTISNGHYSHTEGQSTIADGRSTHVFGEYNVQNPDSQDVRQRGKFVEIVGNGDSNARSNARTLDWQGNETLAGNLTVNGTTLTVNGQQIEPQVQSDWNQTTTTAKDYIKNKPENLSDFNNDEGFIDNTVNNLTNYYDKVQVDQMISSVSHLKIQVVDELPQDPDTDTIYLLPVSGSPSEDNVYEEYIYIMIGSPAEGHWEMIGTAQVDLEGYMQTSMNLSDVDSRQAALNNLTHSSQQDAGKILTIDVNGDAVLSDELSKYTKKSNNLNDVANRQTALNNLTGASSANSGKIMYVDASGDMTLTDRYETAAGMSANELSTHDSRLTSEQISNDYLLIMAMALKNSECKFGINFTIESVDGMSSNAKIVYHFDYFFMKSNQNQFAKLACIHGYSSNESVINQDNAIAITIETEPFYDVVSGVTSTTLPVLKIYRKKVNSAYDNCSYIIHELSKYNPFDGPSDWGLGYCCPKYYVGGNWYAQLKEYEVIATSSDSATTAQIESASEHYFPERTNMFISDMQALTQQEIENILV